ncbi:MAG: OB-fold domain-containing protein [Acidimicrobiia bacterium]
MSAPDPFEVTAPPVVLPPRLVGVEPVERVDTPLRMDYLASSGRHMGAYLRAMKQKRILGERCPTTGQVFVPPRGATPTSGLPTTELVELADRGYVESFCVTRVPIPGRDDLELPYISAWIVLDGANVGFIGLVTGIAPEEVRLGLRVEAVWRPDAELTESANNISSWIPTGEPDQTIESYEIVGTP